MPLTTILILLGVLSLALGPIMLMQPTQAQRRLARLREVAVTAGLRVHLQTLPKTAVGGDRVGMAGVYCLPWQEQRHTRATWLLTKRSYAHELNFEGLWEWQDDGREDCSDRLKTALETVPAKVLALGRGPQGLCCYWSEVGNEEDVKAIAKWLKNDLLAIVV